MTTKLLIIICIELFFTVLVFWAISKFNSDKYKYGKLYKIALIILFILLRINSILEIISKIGKEY
jgi:hypothetical protein